MANSRYFLEIFYARTGEAAAWHNVVEHGTLQGALSSACYWAEMVGKENVALFDRAPSRLDF